MKSSGNLAPLVSTGYLRKAVVGAACLCAAYKSLWCKAMRIENKMLTVNKYLRISTNFSRHFLRIAIYFKNNNLNG